MPKNPFTDGLPEHPNDPTIQAIRETLRSKDAAETFKPLDAKALTNVKTSSPRGFFELAHKRSFQLAFGGGLGLVAVTVTALVAMSIPSAPVTVPAVPVTEPTQTPKIDESPVMEGTPASTPTATLPSEVKDLAEITVSTEGWKKFSSPEYPITFLYPPDWKLEYSDYSPTVAKALQLTSKGIVDGCSTDGCGVHVFSPERDSGSVVLIRNGFNGSTTRPGAIYGSGQVHAMVPELKVWTSESTEPQVATIIKRSSNGYCAHDCSPESPGYDMGPPYEYMLSTGELAMELSAGDLASVLGRPEASFSFQTNYGPEGDEAKIVATILASARLNPNYNPTLPEKDRTGRYKFWTHKSMAAPKTNTDFSDWKTFEVPDGNVSVRVPPKWNATSHGGGINHITAPSGYSVAVLTNGKTVLNCQAKTPLEPSEKLATLPMTVVAVDGISRPLEIWWQDATWHPAEIWLSVVQPSKEDVICSQVPIDYGGKSPVSVGSADNLKNPTREELNQAAAILASLTRLS